VRKAVEEGRQRLALQPGARPNEICLFTFLEDEVWPQVPVKLIGKAQAGVIMATFTDSSEIIWRDAKGG